MIWARQLEEACLHLLSWESLQKNKGWRGGGEGGRLEHVKFEMTTYSSCKWRHFLGSWKCKVAVCIKQSAISQLIDAI